MVNFSLNKEYMIHSGKILATAMELAKSLLISGNTTKQIDSAIHSLILDYKAIPAFIGIGGYPCASCIAVNSQVVHAVPSDIPLKNGDIVTIDIGVNYKKHFTDAARTYIIGQNTNTDNIELVNTAYEALNAGIKSAIKGNRISDISYEIQCVVEDAGFRSPLEFGGHGIGKKPHLEPFIPNSGSKGRGQILKNGLYLAIEPIVMAGSIEVFININDGFTCYSMDGCLSSHVEDTILISDFSPIILTRKTISGSYV